MSNPTSETGLLFADNFEDGISTQWRYETADQDSVQLVDSPDGLGSAVKFQLSKDDPDVHSSKRSELALDLEPANAERWYGFKTFLPSDWQADPSFEIVTQWHAYPDFGLGEGWRSPPLNLHLRDDKWQIDSRWDPKQVTENNNPEPEGGKETLWQGSYETGKWTDWVFHIDWSYESDGIIQVWKDDELILDRQGPNTYNDEKGVYFKTGIYKPDWKYNPDKSTTSTRTLYIDEVHIADASAEYSTVAPSSLTPTSTPTVQNNTNNLSGNLVINGSFENNSVPESEQAFFSSIDGWFTTVGSGVEVKKLSDTFGSPTNGSSWVELDSHSNSGFAQELQTQPEELYQLSFDYSPRPKVSSQSNKIEVYWDNQLIDTITAAGGKNNVWQNFSYQLKSSPAQTTKLEFRASGTNDKVGGFLDDVSVISLSEVDSESASTSTINSNTKPLGDNLVTNGSFENNSVSEGEQKLLPSIEGWFTTFGNGIEIKKLSNTFGAAADGNSWVELDSHSNSGFAQKLDTQVGELYELSFDYSPRAKVGSQSNKIEVYWDNQLIDTITAAGGESNAWQEYTYQLEASLGSTTTLEFRASGINDKVGGFLDDVSVMLMGQEVQGSDFV